MHIRRILFGAIFLSLFWVSSGCGLAALVMSGVEDYTAGPSRRAQLLDSTLNKFHRSVVWGNHPDAAAFVEPEIQLTFFKQYRRKSREEKIVDIEVQDVIFEEDTMKALVDIELRGYAVPNYLVEKRTQTELWRFSRIHGGWRLSNANFDRTAGATLGISDDPATPAVE